MSFSSHITMFGSGAIFAPGLLRVGHLRLSVYGLCAAVGLIAALWLSQRTAKLAGLAAEKLWDAGVLSICAAFVVSRLLLIARDPRAFAKYPLLVLALPSLTYGGMALTAVIVWGYLRWKRLALRDVLDAWAPCGALLGALLSLGHLLEGTDTGMPTRLPWGVVTRGDEALGRVQPVQIYALVAALVLLGALLWMLRQRARRGAVAGVALVAGGTTSFLLDMLTQPMAGMNGAWIGSLLEPGQWLALVAMLAGVWLWVNNGARVNWREAHPPPTRDEVATMLENMVAGSGGPYDHEAIEYGKFNDPLLIELKERMPDLHEGPHHGLISQEESDRIMLDYVRRIRGGGEQSTKESI